MSFKIIGPDRCKKIKTVSKVIHRPYTVSCDEYIPQARQVADKFHVVQRLNNACEEARKELLLSNDIKKSEKKTIKSMNWVIRHKEENMSKKNL
jgi:transposase